jgi:hypothetical protein
MQTGKSGRLAQAWRAEHEEYSTGASDWPSNAALHDMAPSSLDTRGRTLDVAGDWRGGISDAACRELFQRR